MRSMQQLLSWREGGGGRGEGEEEEQERTKDTRRQKSRDKKCSIKHGMAAQFAKTLSFLFRVTGLERQIMGEQQYNVFCL